MEVRHRCQFRRDIPRPAQRATGHDEGQPAVLCHGRPRRMERPADLEDLRIGDAAADVHTHDLQEPGQ